MGFVDSAKSFLGVGTKDGVLEYKKVIEGQHDLNLFFQKHFHDSQQWFASWREESRKHYDMYGGETLSPAERQWRAETYRPPLSLNVALGTINSPVGQMMAERKEARWGGVDTGPEDLATAEIYTRIDRYFMAKCDGHRHQSAAALDCFISGYGYTEQFMDTSKIPIPIVTKHVPNWEMYPDPDALEDCLSDAKFFIRRRVWTLEEAQARWPEHKKILDGMVLSKVLDSHPDHWVEGEWKTDAYTRAREGVEVFEHQFMRHEPRTTYDNPLDEQGNVIPDPRARRTVNVKRKDFDAQMEALSQLHTMKLQEIQDAKENPPPPPPPPAPGMPPEPDPAMVMQAEAAAMDPTQIVAHHYAAEVFYRTYLVGTSSELTVVEHGPIQEGCFTYTCATGLKHKYPDEGRVMFFGLLKTIHDPQLFLNRTAGTILDVLGRGAKGGTFVETGALATSFDDFQKMMAIPGGGIKVKDGAISGNKIKERGSVPMPQGLSEFFGMMLSMVSKISMVTDWNKGTSSQERSNVLIQNMQQQSTVGLGPILDPIALFQMKSARVRGKMIYKYLSIDDINQIIGEFKMEGVTTQATQDPNTGMMMPAQVTKMPGQLVKERDPFQYDISVDLGAASTTHRQAMWEIFSNTDILQTILAMAPQAGMAILPELLRNAPGPAEMMKKLGDTFEQALQQPQQPQQPPEAAGSPIVQ